MTVLKDSLKMTSARASSQPISRSRPLNETKLTSLHNSFDFSAHDKYQATSDLLLTRSASFSVPHKPLTRDVWSIKPPDFRPQNYLPKPPKRNTRESMQPWKYSNETNFEPKTKSKKKHEVKMPKVLEPRRPKSRKMNLKFDILSADEAKKMTVKGGLYPKGKYCNPVPHDFRQYPKLQQLGLPEFRTIKSPDPLDIKFKTKNLDIYHGVPQPLLDEYLGDQMGHPLGLQPTYEPDLLLPTGKWPTIPQEFTRHRPRVRTPHTALMDTIEERLTKQWDIEKNNRKQNQLLMEKQKREEKLRRDIKKGINKAMDKESNFLNEFGLIPRNHDNWNSSSNRSFSTDSDSSFSR